MDFNHANHLYKVEGQVNFKEKNDNITQQLF